MNFPFYKGFVAPSVVLEPPQTETHVTVTWDHMRRATPKGITSCAIALALEEAGFSYVLVGHKLIRVDGEIRPTSFKERLFIRAFDGLPGVRRILPPIRVRIPGR